MSDSKCPVCLDEEVPNDQFVQIGARNRLCFECFNRGIKPDFVAALSYEIKHPVYYYGQRLNINDFGSFFTPEFLAAYHFKLQEYAVPVPERLYCNKASVTTGQTCGQFMGSRANATGPSVICSSCSTPSEPVHICTRCSDSFRGNTNNHTCQPEEEPLKELIRGVHYQICPNEACKIKIELRAACNHMRCSCGAQFCYVCGEVMVSNHFNTGLCPRYGLKGSARAIYDRVRQPVVPVPEPAVVLTPAQERLRPQHQRDIREVSLLYWISVGANWIWMSMEFVDALNRVGELD